MTIKAKEENPNNFFERILKIKFDDLFKTLDISRIKLYKYFSDEFEYISNDICYTELKVNGKNMISREFLSMSNKISLQYEDFEISDKLKNKILTKTFDDEFYDLLGSELEIGILCEGIYYQSIKKCLYYIESSIKYIEKQNDEFEIKINELKEVQLKNETKLNKLKNWNI